MIAINTSRLQGIELLSQDKNIAGNDPFIIRIPAKISQYCFPKKEFCFSAFL
jgi:hypothetical protein